VSFTPLEDPPRLQFLCVHNAVGSRMAAGGDGQMACPASGDLGAPGVVDTEKQQAGRICERSNGHALFLGRSVRRGH